MDYSSRWKIIEELGEGGQGKVYRVYDSSKFNIEQHLRPAIFDAVRSLSATITTEEMVNTGFESFRSAVLQLVEMQDPSHHGALKILHSPQDARDFERAEARINTEIKAMSETSHPNLLRILDTDPDARWFVSQFHSKGTLDKNRHLFVGDFPRVLTAMRPVIEGVAELHKRQIVHRDIKPQNIFLDSEHNLTLGDFGLVYFKDDRHTRVSDTFENVGSRDWMPAWGIGMRIEDVRISFDVFCLGKVLWAMFSGLPMLRLWYFQKNEFNVENLFPKSPFIQFVNPLFEKCIVENEGDCIKDASGLLKEVDELLRRIELNADLINAKSHMRCKQCGKGFYLFRADRKEGGLDYFGINPSSSPPYRIYVCSYCGNVQFFHLGFEHKQTLWNE